MVTGGNLESFLNGVTVGESAGQAVTSNGDVNTIVTAGLNIASTLPQVGTASTVGLYMANTALIPLNMVSAIQNIKNIADNGASVQNVSATASDMAAIASAVAARLALAPIPQAKAAALGLTALSILLKYGPVYGQKFGEWLGQNIPTPYDIQKYFNDLFNRAKNWVWPRDPIILDLDGDGLETVGLASNVYFDHDGDGVLTRTGWAGKDDALLVWDRNGNGRIDTGAELFGDFTVLPNGTLAPNGFAALAALDANGDGIIDASDPAFAELKLWRDADQNGATGAGELISLADAGIVSLNLAHTLKNQRLANGNTLAREGTFTRADGSTSAMGEFKLAIDTFDTRFAEEIEVPEALRVLPNMQGAGNVRELQQAAAQSSSLAGVLAQFQNAGTRAEQKALLDPLLSAWADTSGMAKNLDARAQGQYIIQYEAFGNDRRSDHIDSVGFVAAQTAGPLTFEGMTGALSTDIGASYLSAHYRELIDSWNQKLHALEAFNGQYFFNLPTQKSQTSNANWGMTVTTTPGSTQNSGGIAMTYSVPTLKLNFSTAQLDLLQQAYDSLKESVYASLVMQTRLKPYLDQIELVIDNDGIRLDAAALNQKLAEKKATDPENYLADLLDLDRYAGAFLAGTNWQGLADFDTLIDSLPNTPAIQALLDEFKVRRLTDTDESQWLGDDADIVLAGEGISWQRQHSGCGNDAIWRVAA
ncbi:hypothetical protein [Comamonas kerstersii]|uniref:hypothetical protein n=1 Tax=Comamonas kerstersii TaxID=225992 RepID=UPI002670A3BB|nr:hypothetical protein [Comamonas kerstersii]